MKSGFFQIKMKIIRTVVVFDQGGLIDSEQWARMYERISGAVQKIVYPPGNDRLVIRRKILKREARGEPSKQWLRNYTVPIKRQFLGNLAGEPGRAGALENLESGLADLARNEGKLLMKEYPSGHQVSLDDED